MKRVSKGEKVEKNGKVVAEEPLISVIVPVYNVEKYLDKCVDSIVNQTYKNLEIILVDDGSPDNCPKMCDNWAKKDKRIKVIHKENGGVSSARNVGIDNAKGEYIGFVDSDDWTEKKYIQKLYEVLIQENADIALCGYNRVTGANIEKININGTSEITDCYQYLLYTLNPQKRLWICTYETLQKKSYRKY